MAERVGFEPTVPQKEHNGFRGRRLQPLGHLSAESSHLSITLLSERRIVADSGRVIPIQHCRDPPCKQGPTHAADGQVAPDPGHITTSSDTKRAGLREVA